MQRRMRPSAPTDAVEIASANIDGAVPPRAKTWQCSIMVLRTVEQPPCRFISDFMQVGVSRHLFRPLLGLEWPYIYGRFRGQIPPECFARATNFGRKPLGC